MDYRKWRRKEMYVCVFVLVGGEQAAHGRKWSNLNERVALWSCAPFLVHNIKNLQIYCTFKCIYYKHWCKNGCSLVPLECILLLFSGELLYIFMFIFNSPFSSFFLFLFLFLSPLVLNKVVKRACRRIANAPFPADCRFWCFWKGRAWPALLFRNAWCSSSVSFMWQAW